MKKSIAILTIFSGILLTFKVKSLATFVILRDASTLTRGTLPDARLSANVMLVGSTNSFTVPITFTSATFNGTVGASSMTVYAVFTDTSGAILGGSTITVLNVNQLNVNQVATVSSMTVYGVLTSSTGFIGGGSTFTALNVSGIGGATLSSMTVYGSIISTTGFIGGSSSFTALNVNGIGGATVSSMTVYGIITSSTGFVGGNSTFTAINLIGGSSTFATLNVSGIGGAMLSSMTVYATLTSSTGFIGGSSTMTFFIGDGRLLTNLALASNTAISLFKSTGEAIIGSWNLYRSTGEALTASWNLHLSTAEAIIGSWNLHRSTGESAIDRYNLFVSSFDNATKIYLTSMTSYGTVTSSTGFIGGGSTFTMLNVTGIGGATFSSMTAFGTITSSIGFRGGGSTFTALTINNVSYQFPTSDGTNNQALTTNGSKILSWVTPAAATSTQTYVRWGQVVIATSSQNGADYIGNDSRVFIAAATTTRDNGGGLVFVKNGTYTFYSPSNGAGGGAGPILEIAPNTEFVFERGAVVTTSGTNTDLISCSGTIRGLTIRSPVTTWDSNYFLLLNASATAIDITLQDVNITQTVDSALGTGGLIVMNNFTNVIANQNPYGVKNIPQAPTLTGLKVVNVQVGGATSGERRIIRVANCTGCKITNSNFDLGALGPRAAIRVTNSSFTAIEHNIFTGSGSVLSNTITIGTGDDNYKSGNTKVAHNQFFNGGATTNNGNGTIRAQWAMDTEVSDNQAIDFTPFNTDTFFTVGNDTGTLISGNKIFGYGTGFATGSLSAFLHGNIFRQCPTPISDTGTTTKRRDNMSSGTFLVDD